MSEPLRAGAVAYEDAPLRPFHVRIALASTGGVFADGFGLGIIGIALSAAAIPLALDSLWLGVIGGAALAGLFAGALLTGYAADRFGRRPIYRVNMPIAAALSALQFLITTRAELALVRLAIGCVLGTDYVVSKALLAEFIPRRLRGRMVGSLSIAWAGGYACAYAAGFCLRGSGPQAWRWMLLLSAVPCLCIAPLRLGVPESPLWLVNHGRRERAVQIVDRIFGTGVRSPPPAAGARVVKWRELFSLRWRVRTAVGCVFFVCQVIPYFALGTFVTQVMRALHLQGEALGGLFYNIALFGGAIFGLLIVDRLPRRVFLVASFATAASTLLILVSAPALAPALSILLFAVFAGILSAASNLVYVYLPELFGTDLRASGIGLAIAASRVGSAAATFVLPVVMAHAGPRTALGACIAVLIGGGAFCYRFAPETRNVSLATLDEPNRP